MKYYLIGKPGSQQDKLTPGELTLVREKRNIFGLRRQSYFYMVSTDRAPLDGYYWGEWHSPNNAGSLKMIKEVSEAVALYLIDNYVNKIDR